MTSTYRTMYDSVSPSGIPASADMVAGYPVDCGQGIVLSDGSLDGWQPEDFQKALDEGKGIARIANLTPNWHCCSVADVESGALTLAQVRSFITERNAFRPGTATVYCDLNNLPYLQKAARGLSYSLWLAHWTWQVPDETAIAGYRADLLPGVSLVAVQYASFPAFDVSLVIDPGWHAKTA